MLSLQHKAFLRSSTEQTNNFPTPHGPLYPSPLLPVGFLSCGGVTPAYIRAPIHRVERCLLRSLGRLRPFLLEGPPALGKGMLPNLVANCANRAVSEKRGEACPLLFTPSDFTSCGEDETGLETRLGGCLHFSQCGRCLGSKGGGAHNVWRGWWGSQVAKDLMCTEKKCAY